MYRAPSLGCPPCYKASVERIIGNSVKKYRVIPKLALLNFFRVCSLLATQRAPGSHHPLYPISHESKVPASFPSLDRPRSTMPPDRAAIRALARLGGETGSTNDALAARFLLERRDESDVRLRAAL